ncbi:MAG TPA: hypothetical protein VF828_00560 [Patescibacteria group bacterium]
MRAHYEFLIHCCDHPSDTRRNLGVTVFGDFQNPADAVEPLMEQARKELEKNTFIGLPKYRCPHCQKRLTLQN